MKLIYKIGIGAVIVIVLALIFKPNISKKMYQYIKKELNKDYENQQKKIDSIQELRQKDKQNYQQLIAEKDSKLEIINSKLITANKKIRHNEKLLNDYRLGDFDERFRKFSNLITNKDSISE